MKAIHGGKAKHAKIDAHKIAVLLRGGMLPPAYVSPAEMRATRDVRRRRMPLLRKRAERLAHRQHTNRPYNLPAIQKKLAYKAHRGGGAARFPDPAVQQSIAVDLTRLDSADRLLTDLERALVQTAQAHEAQTFSRLRSLPGGGQLLALVRLDEIHARHRFPRGQAFVSSGRLVTCATASAGKRAETAGKKIGHADLQWAFSEAAVLCWRNPPAGPKDLARSERTHGKDNA
jgi:transposase